MNNRVELCRRYVDAIGDGSGLVAKLKGEIAKLKLKSLAYGNRVTVGIAEGLQILVRLQSTVCNIRNVPPPSSCSDKKVPTFPRHFVPHGTST